MRHQKYRSVREPSVPKRSYRMGLSVMPLPQRVKNHMSKGNKRIQPERRKASHALMTSLYMQTAAAEYFEARFTWNFSLY